MIQSALAASQCIQNSAKSVKLENFVHYKFIDYKISGYKTFLRPPSSASKSFLLGKFSRDRGAEAASIK